MHCLLPFSKTKLFILFGLVTSYNLAFSQSLNYKDMMIDNSYNFYEVVEAADRYFDEHGRGKGSGFKIFERWKSENGSKYFP